MVRIQNLLKYEGSDSGNHARSEQYGSWERNAIRQVFSYLLGINQSSPMAYLNCASYQQSSSITRAWRHIDYSLCLSYVSAAGKGGSIKASWVNKRRKLLKQDLDGKVHKQTELPGNPRSTCSVTLAVHYSFVLNFLKFSEFCSWVCPELPQAASLSTQLTPKQNPGSLMRHCSTSISL